MERSKALVLGTGERYYEPESTRLDAELVLAEAGGADSSAFRGARTSGSATRYGHRVRQPPGGAHARAPRHDDAGSRLRPRGEGCAGTRPADRPARPLQRGLRYCRSAGCASARRSRVAYSEIGKIRQQSVVTISLSRRRVRRARARATSRPEVDDLPLAWAIRIRVGTAPHDLGGAPEVTGRTSCRRTFRQRRPGSFRPGQ